MKFGKGGYFLILESYEHVHIVVVDADEKLFYYSEEGCALLLELTVLEHCGGGITTTFLKMSRVVDQRKVKGETVKTK